MSQIGPTHVQAVSKARLPSKVVKDIMNKEDIRKDDTTNKQDDRAY